MDNFDFYAEYYDMLYRDKDYDAEASYITGLIKKYSSLDSRNMLDMGCGTGKHAAAFAERGFNVTGIDLSTKMTASAEKNQGGKGIEFINADVRSYRSRRLFDVAVSLFHVMSYQVLNNDIISAFNSARENLAPGGLFIFDFWYGPAVLSDPPEVRVKRFQNVSLKIIRLAEPELFTETDTINVNYEIIAEKEGGISSRIRETHKMRYFFLPELEYMLRNAGFEMKEAFKWMTGRAPDTDSWYVCCVCVKKQGGGQ